MRASSRQNFGAWLHQNVLLPLYDGDQYRGLAGRMAELQSFDSMRVGEQVDLLEQRVRGMLDHAYKTSPYYRLVFDQIRFRSEDWEYGEPLPLPELNRELVRANVENLSSRTYRPDQLRRVSSGATTHVPPTAIWRDEESHRNKAALQYHLNRISGFELGMRILEVRGSDRDSDPSQHRLRRLYEEKVLGCLTASVRRQDDAGFRNLLDILNRYQPDVIRGPSSTLALFAEWLRGWAAHWHRPQLVIAVAETPSVEARQMMAETFGCRITAQYVCPDVGLLASECRDGERLHFHPWASYVSLVPAGRTTDGTVYRLIITDLLNYGMPMIRYDSGDRVLFEETPCTCGSWYPSIPVVLGPAIENLVLPDGTLVAGVPMVMRAKRALRTVREVQLVQKAIDSMLLRFSATGDSADADEELSTFRRNVESTFRMPLRWTVERVNEIPRENSGKLRVAICELPHQQDGAERTRTN